MAHQRNEVAGLIFGIFHNDPGELRDHCLILCNLRVVGDIRKVENSEKTFQNLKCNLIFSFSLDIVQYRTQ